ncbi:MAG: hypothetical protein MJE68_08675 [Proteobacteria bacterium]|nr:hypothetical protein [Pseudomonadota bacterium]
MPATPNGNGEKPPRHGYDPVEGGTDRADIRHEEIMSVHKEIAKSSTAIQWATWVYAVAALAMLLVSLADIFLF